MDSIFQPGKADFSGLSRNAPKELSIAQILQKVVIDVNELGSTKLPSNNNNNIVKISSLTV